MLDRSGDDPEVLVVDFLLVPNAFATVLGERRVAMDFDGTTRWVCSCEDLIILKLVSGRAKDIEDITGMLRIQQSGVDRGYIDQSARSVNCEEAWGGLRPA